MAEGAAVMILEEYEHAVERGAEIIAEVCGYGNTCDAYHVTAPRPDGKTQAAAIRMALDEAGYTSDDVLYICAHGTGTALNDGMETKAFKFETRHIKSTAKSIKKRKKCIKNERNRAIPPYFYHYFTDLRPFANPA